MSRQPTVASHARGNGQISTRITRRFIISYQGIIFNTYIPTNWQFLKSVGFSSKWKDHFSLLWSLNICHCSCSCFRRTMKWQFSTLLWAISRSTKQKQKPKICSVFPQSSVWDVTTRITKTHSEQLRAWCSPVCSPPKTSCFFKVCFYQKSVSRLSCILRFSLILFISDLSKLVSQFFFFSFVPKCQVHSTKLRQLEN